MGDHSSHRALVYDLGLFVEIASTLSKSFGEVIYTTPWESASPQSNQRIIGEGMPGIKRVQEIWPYLDTTDIFVFPDWAAPGLQMHLRSLGKRVWGSGYGEQLENNRPLSKKHLIENGIPVGEWSPVYGIDALRTYLKSHDNTWIKVSCTRGDFETFHAIDYKEIEPKINELEYQLGAKGKHYEFVCESGIDKAVEVGYDGYCVDGQFPSRCMYGIEAKGQGYIGHFTDYEKHPEPIREVNEKIATTLAKYQYRNMWALECRIDRKGTPWAIDPCCRFGSPPNELQQVMYTNLADIIWEGADGNCIDPIPADEYGAELIIHASFSDHSWMAVSIPDEIKEFVKIRNCTRIDGEYYIIPQSVPSGVGGVVATGPTPEAAMETCKSYAKRIKGYTLETSAECLGEIGDEIEKLASFGITF